MAKFTTVTDLRTDVLAASIAAALKARLGGRPFLVVAKFSRKYLDVNRPAAEAYESPPAGPYYEAYQAALRAACAAVLAKWGAGLLVDVHGQGRHVQAILRGTNSGRTVAHLVRTAGPDAVTGPASVCGVLVRLGYTLLPPLSGTELAEAELDGGYIVLTYGSAAGGAMDAIQLEFGTSLRAPDRLARTAADTAEALAVFARAYLAAPPARPRPRPESFPLADALVRRTFSPSWLIRPNMISL